MAEYCSAVHNTLAKVITAVDGSRRVSPIKSGEGLEQIEVSDLVVLTNLDRVHPAERLQVAASASDHIRTVAPKSGLIPSDTPIGTLKDKIFAQTSARIIPRTLGTRQGPSQNSRTHNKVASSAFSLNGYIAGAQVQGFASAISCFFPNLMRFKMLTGPRNADTSLINITDGALQSLEILAGLQLDASHVYIIDLPDTVAAVENFVRSQINEPPEPSKPDTNRFAL